MQWLMFYVSHTGVPYRRFTGTAGTAVITMDKALLLTDGRYFLQVCGESDMCWGDRCVGVRCLALWPNANL